ncbi:hypothetical protein [Streptomyces sp. IBSBF 2435]|uniref:hypothetical protein n=1 Tax=Streptomyces sp. IBSBF 2435 TaxID=2903531 RepID=UPI002FDC5813
MMPLVLVLAPMVGTALAALAVYFWPTLMSWAREHLLPWVDRVLPGLAADVRLAFQNLDKISVDLRRAVRGAWHRLRRVLLSEVATFVQLADDQWAVRITSFLRNVEDAEKPVVKIVSEQPVSYDDLPDNIRAQVLTGGLKKASLDIVEGRDQLLSEVD